MKYHRQQLTPVNNIYFMEIPLVDKEYLLQKFEVKGGWTYAQVPEILPNSNTPFGWVRVKGTIDGEPINAYHLMPMGNGNLFLPVKAAIRKKIKKQAGDTVHVILFLDQAPLAIPGEIREVLSEEPRAWDAFQQWTSGEQKKYIDWIYGAKTEATKVNRIVKLLEKLA